MHGVGCKAHPGTAKGIRALPHVVWQGGDFCASKISPGVPALPGATESPIDPRRGRIGAGCVTPSYPVFPLPALRQGVSATARLRQQPGSGKFLQRVWHISQPLAQSRTRLKCADFRPLKCPSHFNQWAFSLLALSQILAGVKHSPCP